MKEGFLGGALSSTWPLLEIQKRKPRLKCSKKKIDDKEQYEIEYRPNTNIGDLNLKLYFDTGNFHHVRTEYRVRIVGDMSVRPSSARIFDAVPDSYYMLIEKFDDFRDEEGLMLPHDYAMDYSVVGQGSSFLAHWAMTLNQRVYNGTINPLTFKAQK